MSKSNPKSSTKSNPSAATSASSAVSAADKKSRAAELSFVVSPETSGLKQGFVGPSRAAIGRQLPNGTSVVIAAGSPEGPKVRLSRGKGATVIASPLNLDAEGNEIKRARKSTIRTVYRVADPQTSGIAKGQLFNSVRAIVSAMGTNSSVVIEDANTQERSTVTRATTTFKHNVG